MKDSEARWKEFRGEPFRSLRESPIPDHLIPLHGTPEFAGLSEEEKARLYRSFTLFMAEFFILLERMLIVAFRPLGSNAKAHRISREEFFHYQAFRRFLRKEVSLGHRTDPLMLHRWRGLRGFMTALVRRVPLAMVLPGAKIEAYSVYYAKELKEHFGSENANSWTRLNWLHLLDEAQHVPFEFDIHRDVFAAQSLPRKLATVLGVAIYHFYLQWILIVSMVLVGLRSLDPERGRLRRLRLSLGVLRWASRIFPPGNQMRGAMRAQFRERSPQWAFLLRYISR